MRSMISLASARGLFRITSIACGRGCVNKLASMGIMPGEVVRVINNGSGPVMVEVKGSRVAIGRGVAMKIYGEEL
jgi:ferrous iron transport protein A